MRDFEGFSECPKVWFDMLQMGSVPIFNPAMGRVKVALQIDKLEKSVGFVFVLASGKSPCMHFEIRKLPCEFLNGIAGFP